MTTHSKKIGNIEVTALSDGVLATSLDVVLGMDRAEVRRLAGSTDDDGVRIAVNAFLLKLQGRWALIDAGAATAWGRRSGSYLSIFAPSASRRRKSPPSFSPISIPTIPTVSSMTRAAPSLRTRS
jgi:hypothetical protein